MGESESRRNPALCWHERHEALLQVCQDSLHVWPSASKLTSLTQHWWNNAHQWEIVHPGEMGRALRCRPKQTIPHQWRSDQPTAPSRHQPRDGHSTHPAWSRKAIHQLSSGKAPGADAIPVDVYKHAWLQLHEKKAQLFQAMWTQGAVPQDFKDASVVHLYKQKGSRQACDNHRGISLLCIAGRS